MKLTEGGRLERPNLCWICERTPAIGTPVIDTERYFDGHPFSLQGRRYVCLKCVQEMAKFFGFVPSERMEQAEIAKQRAEGVVRGVKLQLDRLSNELKALAVDPGTLIVEEDSVLDIPEVDGNEVAAIIGAIFGGLPEEPESDVAAGDQLVAGSDFGPEGGHRAPDLP